MYQYAMKYWWVQACWYVCYISYYSPGLLRCSTAYSDIFWSEDSIGELSWRFFSVSFPVCLYLWMIPLAVAYFMENCFRALLIGIRSLSTKLTSLCLVYVNDISTSMEILYLCMSPGIVEVLWVFKYNKSRILGIPF